MAVYQYLALSLLVAYISYTENCSVKDIPNDSTWFLGVLKEGQPVIKYKYTQTSIQLLYGTSTTPLMDFQCVAVKDESNSKSIYIRKFSVLVQCCVDTVLGNYLLHKEVKVDDTQATDPSICPALLEADKQVYVMLKEPLSRESGICPFKTGTYHVSLDDGAGSKCVDSQNSTATVTNNKMTISTCSREIAMDVYCMAIVDEAIVGTTGQGSVLILSVTNDDKKYLCARYTVSGEKIYLSLDLTTYDYLSCWMDASHASAGVVDSRKFISLVLGEIGDEPGQGHVGMPVSQATEKKSTGVTTTPGVTQRPGSVSSSAGPKTTPKPAGGDRGAAGELTLKEDLDQSTSGAANSDEAAESVQRQLAEAGGVDPSRLESVQLSEGSTVVKFKVKPGGPGEQTSQEVVDRIKAMLESGDLVLKSPDGKPLTFELGSFKQSTSGGGKCEFPSSWKQTAWFAHYDDNGAVWVANFSSGDRVAYSTPRTSPPQSKAYECEASSEDNGKFYYVAKSGDDSLKCFEYTQKDHVIFQKSATTTSSDVSSCKEELKKNETMAGALVKYPLEIRDSRCPMSDGDYQVILSESEGQWQCLGAATSYAKVDGSELKLDTCSTRPSTYFYPYMTTLYCVSYTQGSVIDSDENGGVLILAYEFGTNKERYYCARYRIDGDNVYLSVNVFNEKKIECGTGSSYEKSADTATSKYRAFLLKPQGGPKFKARIKFAFLETLSASLSNTTKKKFEKSLRTQISKLAGILEQRVAYVTVSEGSTMCETEIMPGSPGSKTVPDAVNSLKDALESTAPAATSPNSAPLTYKPGSFDVTYYPIDAGEANSVDCNQTPCVNNGSCVAVRPDEHVCVCQTGFSGSRCEKGGVGTGEFPVIVLVILVVAAALIVFIVAAGLMICAIARTKQEQQQPQFQRQESAFPEQNVTAWHSIYDTSLKVDNNIYI